MDPPALTAVSANTRKANKAIVKKKPARSHKLLGGDICKAVPNVAVDISASATAETKENLEIRGRRQSRRRSVARKSIPWAKAFLEDEGKPKRADPSRRSASLLREV